MTAAAPTLAWQPDVRCRPYAPAVDADLVFASWLRVLSRTRPYCQMDEHHRARLYEALIHELATPETTLVAYDAPTGELIGYVCGEPEPRVLHFVLVKPDYKHPTLRERGLPPQRFGTQLMAARFGAFGPASPPIRCTFWTPAIRHLAGKWHLLNDARPLRPATRF